MVRGEIQPRGGREIVRLRGQDCAILEHIQPTLPQVSVVQQPLDLQL